MWNKTVRTGLILTFSDGTTGAYVVEELLELRPNRELAHQPGRQNPPRARFRISLTVRGSSLVGMRILNGSESVRTLPIGLARAAFDGCAG